MSGKKCCPGDGSMAHVRGCVNHPEHTPTPVPPDCEALSAAPETETDANGLRVRLVERQREWLWNEATDDALAGYGHHMSQMLYRLPVDGQTRDMQSSIESMLADMSALLADLDAARERVRVVEDERDAARGDLVFSRQTTTNVMEALADSGAETLAAIARADSAEAAHEAEKAALMALADEWAAIPVDEDPWAFEKARALRSLLGGGEAR